MALLLLVDAALVWLDDLTGPYIPFTVFYIALLYFTMTRVGSTWSYLVALISSMGHTFSVSHDVLHHEQLGFAAWQFATSFSVLSMLCVLLDRRLYARPARAVAQGSSRPLDGQSDRRAALFTKNTDRYTPMFILLSVGFLAAFVPWIHDANAPGTYCAGDGEAAMASAATRGSQAGAVIRTKTLLLVVVGGPDNFDADSSILDGLDRHLAKSIWLIDCAAFDPFIQTHAVRNLQTLHRLARDGHVIAVRGHAAPEKAQAPDRDGPYREAAKCGAVVRDKVGLQPVEFATLFEEIPLEVDGRPAGGAELAIRREVDFDSALDFQPGAGSSGTLEAVMDHLVGSLQSNDAIMIHDSQRNARGLDAFLTLAEKNGYSFALPERRRASIRQRG